jgi:hypothetical protein
MLTLAQQADFVRELPEVFVPIRGGWGRMGATHIRLGKENEDVLAGALLAAWKLRVKQNAKTSRKKRGLNRMSTTQCLTLLVLAIACSAQSVSPSFDGEYARGIQQNPPGVRLTIETIPQSATYHFFDAIRFTLKFTSDKAHLYTAELAPESAAGVSYDFVIQGPGMAAPIHSQLWHPFAYVCCGGERRYLSQKPRTGAGFRVSLGYFLQPAPLQPSRPMESKPGDYAVFVQTRSVMRGWPKSSRDAFHSVSDLVVTSANILHLTILPDVAGTASAKP